MNDSSVHALALLLVIGYPLAYARTWQDVVDPTIYLASAIDTGRLESSLEKDPFDFRPQPTASPTYQVEESANSPSIGPSLVPTQSDTSSSPTLAPTPRYDFIVGNGGCPTGLTLFEVRFVDSWGDGWGSTSLEIIELSSVADDSNGNLMVLNVDSSSDSVSQTVKGSQVASKSSKVVFSGSLARGSEAFKYACLDVSKCFSVEVGGGTWEDEAKWEIRMVKLGVPREERDESLATAKGLAPTKCQFSVANKVTDELPCPVTCGERVTESPTQSPSGMPTLPPSSEVDTLPPSTASQSGSWHSSDTPSQTPTVSRYDLIL